MFKNETSGLERRAFLKKGISTIAIASIFSEAGFTKGQQTIKTPRGRGKELVPLDFSNLLENPPLGFSIETLENHLGLYKKYVKQFNTVSKKLKKKENTGHDNLIKKGFSYGGLILHELYFKNITHKKESLNYKSSLYRSIEGSFESISNFLDLFVKAGSNSRGWTILGLNLSTADLEIYNLDSHNEGANLTFIWPILVLDVYEHAYLIDYGTDKLAYVNNFVNRISWSILENRFKTGVSILGIS